MTKRNPYEKFLTIENREQKRCVEWLNYYPPTKNVLWFHPAGEGNRSAYERYLFSVLGGKRSVPDFLFFKRRGGYCGLAIELKPLTDSKGVPTVVFNKDGSVRADKKDQWEFLLGLRQEGWSSNFAVGIDDFMKQVKTYFE